MLRIFSIILFMMSTAVQSDNLPKKELVETYISIAKAGYEDSLATARALESAVVAFTDNPTEHSLAVVKAAWLAARIPYQQTEVFRFGNPVVDNWEGRVNAWPLDEGLIDYVAAGYGDQSEANPLYTVNVIANSELVLNGKKVSAKNITTKLLADTIHEAEGVEANVATGYHAIEFLLWGQDLNGNQAGQGNRPHTDYLKSGCTGGNCERRAQYLRVVTQLLVEDLEEMVGNWQEGGVAVKYLRADTDRAISAMIMGMGSLSYGELAGERMQLGLFLNDPEEEHDCFADNTHNSHYFDQIGISNVYFGTYRRIDGSVVKGTSLAETVQKIDGKLGRDVEASMNGATAALAMMRARAESVEAYDQMLSKDNPAGNAMIQAGVQALVKQARAFEKLDVAMGLKEVSFEGSDSLDNPEEVFK